MNVPFITILFWAMLRMCLVSSAKPGGKFIAAVNNEGLSPMSFTFGGSELVSKYDVIFLIYNIYI
jgi:hypothetical protein